MQIFNLNVEQPELDKQRALLSHLLRRLRLGQSVMVDKDDREALEGLENLLGAIADQLDGQDTSHDPNCPYRHKGECNCHRSEHPDLH